MGYKNICGVRGSFQKRVKNIGWSGWSEWSTCSRSCDGGVAQQLRRCHAPTRCRGESIRYKICNMQVYTYIYNIYFYISWRGVLQVLSITIIVRNPSAVMSGSEGFSNASVRCIRRRAVRWATVQMDDSLRLRRTVCADVQVKTYITYIKRSIYIRIKLWQYRSNVATYLHSYFLNPGLSPVLALHMM